MIMIAKSLVLLSMITITTALSDKSFYTFCENAKSQDYRAADPSQSYKGDRCTMEFIQYTETDEDAKEFCEIYVPFVIVESRKSAENDEVPKTTCIAEATVVCPENYIQLFGRCFKHLNNRFTKAEAIQQCKTDTSIKGTLLTVHNEHVLDRLQDYYIKLDTVWIEQNDGLASHVTVSETTVGDDWLFMFSGASYYLPDMTITKVKGESKHEVICEVIPAQTLTEVQRILKRYEEIYFPFHTSTKSMTVRTASSYAAMRGREPETEHCQKAMKVFGTAYTRSFVPYTDPMKALQRAGDSKDVYIRRISARIKTDSWDEDRKRDYCVAKGLDYFSLAISRIGQEHLKDKDMPRFNFASSIYDKPSFTSNGCDDVASSAIAETSPNTFQAIGVPDVMWAPLLCEFNPTYFEYEDCPSGWTTTNRKTGQRWCHKGFKEVKSWDNAQAHCQTEGGYLTGFESYEELEQLQAIANEVYPAAANSWRNGVWLGARRHELCKTGGTHGLERGFDPNPDSQCAIERVVAWRNDVAQDYGLLVRKYWYMDTHKDIQNPSYYGGEEECLDILPEDKKNLLNDFVCNENLAFICGKEAGHKKVDQDTR